MLQTIGIDLVYLVLATVLSVFVGLPAIRFMVGKDIRLGHALFGDDNPVAGFEVAGMLLLIFYQTHCMLQGDVVGSTLGSDLLATTVGIVASVALMTLVRAALSTFVRIHTRGQDLNHEIFVQRNWAAACMSLALCIGVVNGITEEDVFGPNPLRDGAIALTIVVLGLGVTQVYRFTHMRGAHFMGTFFTHDNPAAGVSLLGFAVAANIVSFTAASVVKKMSVDILTSVLYTGAYSTGLLILLVVLRYGVEVILKRAWRHDIPDEIFVQKNLGAAFIDAAIVVGGALVVTVSVV
jgi:hypothetical protein